ncbi:caspase family protein [Nitrosomonas sp.]|uniref:caspase family protein n=1 Tax=Nitrosomonas sp. TaxID=42353 RepID=UPI0032EAE110
MLNKLFEIKQMMFYLSILILITISCTNVFAANHALLIGIANYPSGKKESVNPLKGPHNDVKLMETILLEKPFNFSKDNIEILLDQNATHTGIKAAFEGLKARTKPGDFVFIFYAGHGSQTKNDNPEVDKEQCVKIQGECQQFDQTLVPFGSRTGLYGDLTEDDRDIRDDEINVWLSEIGNITDRIVTVFDSCHSGSATRAPVAGVRGISMDTRLYPKTNAVARYPLKGISIGASKSVEVAHEISINEQSYGRFTWFFSEALEALKPGETWGDVFRRTEALMREESMNGLATIEQHPQITFHSGNKDLEILGEFTDLKKSIVVTAADVKEVRLSAGSLSGVTKGSIYRVLNPLVESSEVEITAVTPFSSVAKILNGKIKSGDILVESQHAYSIGKIKILIESDEILAGDQRKNLSVRISDYLKNFSEFELVSERQNDGWIIYLFQPEQAGGKYVNAPGLTLPSSKKGAELQAWVLSMKEELLDDTMRVNLSDLENGLKELTRKMKNMAYLNDLKKIRQDRDPPNVNIFVHQLIEDENCNKDKMKCFSLSNNNQEKLYKAIDSVDLKSMNNKKLPPGSIIGFSVENKAQQNYYLYLLNISARDGAFVQFPPKDRPPEYALVNIGIPKDLDGAIYFPNTGRETIKVILSAEAIDTTVFESEGTRDAGTRGSSLLNPLERLLSRSATRGQSVAAPGPSKWGTMEAEMLIER